MKISMLGSAAALGAAALSMSAPAAAFTQETNEVFGESYGNSEIFGGFSVTSRQSNSSGTVGVVIPGGFSILPYLDSAASQDISTSVKFFGNSAKPIVGSLKAGGNWRYEAGSKGILSPTASAKLVVLGNTVYSSAGTACTTSKRCVTANKSYEKTFVNGTFTFRPFGFTVNVSGSVIGSVGADLDANATAQSYLGFKDSMLSRVNAGWGAHAGLTAAFNGCVGLISCELVGLEIEPRFEIFTLDVGPKASSAQGSNLNGNAKYSGTNKAGVTLSTMNGKVIARAHYLFGTSDTELVSWSGYSDSWDLWSKSPSYTCEDYRSQPSSACRSWD